VSLELDKQRGQQAQAIISDPVYAESYSAVETEIILQWRAARDKDDREQLHLMLLMLEKVRQSLESVMRSGQVATAEIERKRSKAELMADAYWDRRLRG
jgi:hypothetical protein